MNVLLVTPQPPYPPTQGAALRNLAILRHLARRHSMHLLSFADTEVAGGTPPAELLRHCRQVTLVPRPRRRARDRLRTLLTSRLPDMATRLTTAAFRRRLDELLAKTRFDVVQFEGIELAPYLLALPCRSRPALVFDDHNAEHLLQRRTFEIDRRDPRRLPGALYSLVQWRRLADYERAACRHADAVVAVSAEDRRALLALDPALDVRIVANGVDVGAYSSTGPTGGASSEPPSLVFVGTMGYRPNVDAVVWFCTEVLPRIGASVPTVQLTIVGRGPTPAVLKLRSHRVEVTGAVPDDLPYLVGATVSVVPMRVGGGMRFKILQAMAAGVPTVTTKLGAEGIDVADGVHCRVADEADSFADAVITLLQDPERRRTMAAAARRFVADRFDWNVTLAPLGDLYDELARTKSA
ncbi:MAG: glycosyltransferase [Chloroflexi bacterium]|nr:glycosyltransferase [Chloroflexota bacterium]